MKLPIPFAHHTTYAGHSGIDFPQPRGTKFRASGNGIVGLLKETAFGGKMIWVDYDDLPKGRGVGYAHMDSWADCPPVGTRVVEGTVLGRVGSSGRSTGPHLHIEIAHEAGAENVWKYFDPARVVNEGAPSTVAPPFPLARGQFFGPEGMGANSISGWHSHRDDLKRYQQRMKDRGWAMIVDGLYGPLGATTPTGNTAEITIAFQKEKGLYPDGFVGPNTWNAAWTSPVT